MADVTAALERLKKLDEVVPPGPWSVEQPEGQDCVWTDVVAGVHDDEILNFETLPRPHICHLDYRFAAQEDIEKMRELATFVAVSRNAFPALRACAEALQKITMLPHQYANACDTANTAIELAHKSLDALAKAVPSE